MMIVFIIRIERYDVTRTKSTENSKITFFEKIRKKSTYDLLTTRRTINMASYIRMERYER